MKKFFILVCSCALLAACNNSAKTNKSAGADSTSIEATDIHNAENSLDYEGTYKGVFPAADCPGIEITPDIKSGQNIQPPFRIYR